MSFFVGGGCAGDQGARVVECDDITGRIINIPKGFFVRAAFCDEHIMFEEKIDEETVQRLMKRSRELFEQRDSRLVMPVGSSDENAISVAKDVEAAGWHVFYDENGYPVHATTMDKYEFFKSFLPDNEPDLELKLTWLFFATVRAGSVYDFVCNPGVWGKSEPDWSDDVYGGKREG